mmetsp:Transcript_73343/g.148877  ORF Transcript_73343/g.148877 Transcript_73343/m.148877 type:complete len:280 (-) Transcript_73343:2770-3609(-)
MLLAVQVRLEHKANAHGVAPELRDVNRCGQLVAQLEPVCLGRNDLYERHELDEDLRRLPCQLPFLDIPACALEVEAFHIRAVQKSRRRLRSVFVLRYLGIERRLVQRPASPAARGLHKGAEQALGNVEATEPKDGWVALGAPIRILLVATQVVIHPAAQGLLRLRGELDPCTWQLPVEHGGSKLVERLTHADLSLQGPLQVCEMPHHFLDEVLVTLDLLHEYHLQGRGHAVLVELQLIFGDLLLDVSGRLLDELVAAHPATVSARASLHGHEPGVDLFG